MCFMREWKKKYATISLGAWEAWGNVMDMLMFCYFGTYLYNALFFDWAYSSTACYRPDILLPEADESLVGKHSRVVIYYVAGLILHTIPIAETSAKDEPKIDKSKEKNENEEGKQIWEKLRKEY